MKLKKLIALLLSSVYLLAVAGAAYASLSCECIRHQHTHAACCHHCVQECDSDGVTAFSASCCDDNHSTDIELYTRVLSDDEDLTSRVLILDLPASLAAECPCPAHVPLLRLAFAERRTPFIRDVYIPGAGFRAPPVLA